MARKAAHKESSIDEKTMDRAAPKWSLTVGDDADCSGRVWPDLVAGKFRATAETRGGRMYVGEGDFSGTAIADSIRHLTIQEAKWDYDKNQPVLVSERESQQEKESRDGS